MSAFSTADIPVSVTTLEELVLWACGAFYQLHKNTRYQESDNAALIPIVTMQDGLAADKTERAIFRVSIPMNDGWRVSSNKFFLEGLEVANAAIPAAFLP